jgi:hypothetical protein
MLVSLDAHQMHSPDGNSLIKSACDKLSEYGIENFIHWSDEISVDIAGESHGYNFLYLLLIKYRKQLQSTHLHPSCAFYQDLV